MKSADRQSRWPVFHSPSGVGHDNAFLDPQVVHPPRQPAASQAAPPGHLVVETLEQRWVPSFTVTNLLDDGSVGSLRWAVAQANATGGDPTIDFDPIVFATAQTITPLELSNTTGTETITAPAAGVTISGGGLSRVFQIDRGVAASISGLTISSGHTTFSGGGILNNGTLTLSASTVSGNSAGRDGGGIFNTGTMSLTNCTVRGNSAGKGGGLYSQNAPVTLSNTIVAANTVGGNPSDISGNVNANSSYNLIGTGGSGGLRDGVNHNQVGVGNPGLGTLGDHGGPTQTINLLGGSPALNTGDPAQLGLPNQRGVVRTGGVNIGAYQASASAVVLTAPDTVTAVVVR